MLQCCLHPLKRSLVFPIVTLHCTISWILKIRFHNYFKILEFMIFRDRRGDPQTRVDCAQRERWQRNRNVGRAMWSFWGDIDGTNAFPRISNESVKILQFRQLHHCLRNAALLNDSGLPTTCSKVIILKTFSFEKKKQKKKHILSTDDKTRRTPSKRPTWTLCEENNRARRPFIGLCRCTKTNS